jgi:hypothetical protein
VIMSPSMRNFVLTTHVASSVGTLGAVVGFLALALAGLTSPDVQTVRSSYIAMEPIAWWVIVPLILGSLTTGIVQSLGTPWGLFRHYWVLIKLLVTLFVAVVLFLQLGLISDVAEAAATREFSPGPLWEARLSLAIHAGAGLFVLLVPTVLSVYKPRGLTAYGAKRQAAENPSRCRAV